MFLRALPPRNRGGSCRRGGTAAPSGVQVLRMRTADIQGSIQDSLPPSRDRRRHTHLFPKQRYTRTVPESCVVCCVSVGDVVCALLPPESCNGARVLPSRVRIDTPRMAMRRTCTAGNCYGSSSFVYISLVSIRGDVAADACAFPLSGFGGGGEGSRIDGRDEWSLLNIFSLQAAVHHQLAVGTVSAAANGHFYFVKLIGNFL